MEDWAEIRRLHRAEGMPIRAICRQLGVGRNTVRRALAAPSPPKYQRAAKGSIVDEVEPQIRELLKAWPSMPATVIAERIGWTRSITVLKDRVRLLRPLFLPPDPAQRTDYVPGELAQCDLWFPPVEVPLGFGQVGSPPVLVMVAGYSRWMSAVMIPVAADPGLVDRSLEADLAAGCGAEGVGMGQRVWGRAMAWRPAAADHCDERVPRRARDPSGAMPAGGSGVQGSGRARQRVPGDLVPTRTKLYFASGFQRPA